ncbi:hypothetical protein CFIICLFH_4996 [Methylobacterium goesingense]|nr:hypothetical protein CFIICLFH_4996 [Methylobacterium goesingense]
MTGASAGRRLAVDPRQGVAARARAQARQGQQQHREGKREETEADHAAQGRQVEPEAKPGQDQISEDEPDAAPKDRPRGFPQPGCL